ncbi:hypothetical protein [Bradyrhizobium embrapense]|uniref:hypothetical protein n=1 Tax=Bradyrhizobium embrapense TaxID=630921 RepID=UPI00067DC3AB|nr:hypothetical protein [Bradyrhizobium embrapense]
MTDLHNPDLHAPDLHAPDLHAWLSRQPHGLRTFRTFQQKLETLGKNDPEQRGVCRLLSGLVGNYVEIFDEEPLPVAVADRAYGRLLDLVASLDLKGSPDRRLADINRIASCDLLN